MRITNETGLPQPIVDAVSKDNYSKGASNRSVTQLIDSPRVRILRTEKDDFITEDVTERVWSVLGNAVHLAFAESTGEGHIPEERLYYETDGWVVSGAMDLQTKEANGTVTITDYKCTSIWAIIYGKDEWVYQLNAYAWLARHAKGVLVDKLQIVCVLRDWNRNEAARRHDYPVAPLIAAPIPLWSDDDQDAYMAARIKCHSDAEFNRLTGGDLPLCSDHERWAKPDAFAVMKGKAKRATRVFDSREEAEQFMREKDMITTHHIDVRKGSYSRCEGNYCGVAAYCDQYQKEIEELKGAEA